MPYGLSTAPATFSHTISIILSGLTYETCLCYFDAVIVFSTDIHQHCQHLSTVLQQFRDQNLNVKASKWSFASDKVVYLGHTVSQHGIHTDPLKAQAITDLTAPSNLDELRSFLGLVGYYRRFIPRFATVASPLTALTKKGVRFVRTDLTENAFQVLKTCLSSASIIQTLRSPLFFKLTPLTLDCVLCLHNLIHPVTSELYHMRATHCQAGKKIYSDGKRSTSCCICD